MFVCLAFVANYRLTVGVETALPYGGDAAASPLVMFTNHYPQTTGFALAFDCLTHNLLTLSLWFVGGGVSKRQGRQST